MHLTYYIVYVIYQLSISQYLYKTKMLLAATIWLYLCTNYTFAIQSGRLMAPASITALSGDLHVQLQLFYNIKTINSTNNYSQFEEATTSTLVISKYIKNNKKATIEKILIRSIPVFPDPRQNVTQITVPCETFAWAGTYEMQFVTNLKTNISQASNISSAATHLVTTTLMPLHDERLHQTLDVRWPRAYIQLSHTRLSTYPDTIVHVTLSFREGNCENAFNATDMPEFWLELMYCGKDSSCAIAAGSNVSKTSIFYAEQVRGFPIQQNITLNCELFGLAGIYAVQLRPMQAEILPNFPMTRRFINVDWSEKFVFNVFARSIFPCDPHTGIGVLFEYPHCILEQSDRVRVYAKLRADVASLKPPTSLHYVAEQRVVKNQHSLHFSCEIFSEKYVEYCFVYVSQALTGAVADVRMDCVPTLPVSDSDTGGWGPWSEWTPCSTNCLGGTRNRYRFCDSPPPRYGAKFCEGSSVETQKCNATYSDKGNCIDVSNFSALDNNENNKVNGIIGPGCSCGCIVHIGSLKHSRVIASVLQNCPGKSYWLIQADARKRIALSFKFIRLPCASQYIKVRNGPSLSSKLLNEIQSNEFIALPAGIESTDSQVLLEIYAGDQITSFAKEHNNSYNKDTQNNLIGLHCNGGFSLQVQEIVANETTTIVASTKQLFKTREIKRIMARSGLSLVHIIVLIFASITLLISAFLGLQFIIRYQKYHLALAQNCEDGLCLQPPHGNASLNSLNRLPSRAVSTTTLLSEVICLVKMRSKPNVRHSILRESLDAEILHKQTTTLDETIKIEKNMREDEDSIKETTDLKKLNTLTSAESTLTLKSLSENANTGQLFVVDIHTDTSSSRAEKNESESIDSFSTSNSCNSPTALESTLGVLNHRKERMKLKRLLQHKDEISLDISSGSSRSVSRSNIISLTHAQFSPYKNCMSTAAMKATRLKEAKEKQNRKKLLSRPNSDMSLGNHDSELEMDYYDYDVINAAANPGSYFSMDPAHLIWIPPFDVNEENLDNQEILSKIAEFHSSSEINKSESFYKELKLNRYRHYFWPQSSSEDSITPTNTNTSNTAATTPTSFKLLSALNKSNLLIKPVSPSKANNLKNAFVKQTICAGVSDSINYSELNKQLKSTRSLYNINRKDLQESQAFKSELNFALNSPDLENSDSYMEKETNVVKSQSDLQSYLAVNDILFADDTEGEYDV